MSDREPMWQTTDLDNLRKLDESLAGYVRSLESRAGNVEVEAVVLGVILGEDFADDHRLIASTLRRSSEQIAETRIDIRVRLRALERDAS